MGSIRVCGETDSVDARPDAAGRTEARNPVERTAASHERGGACPAGCAGGRGPGPSSTGSGRRARESRAARGRGGLQVGVRIVKAKPSIKTVGSRTDRRLTFCKPPKSKPKSAAPGGGHYYREGFVSGGHSAADSGGASWRGSRGTHSSAAFPFSQAVPGSRFKMQGEGKGTSLKNITFPTIR
jgi:hypothetical protein